MKTRRSNFTCMKLVMEWWENTSQLNVLNGITFYKLHSQFIFFKVEYYNTNVCKHEEIILRVNREDGTITIKEETK